MQLGVQVLKITGGLFRGLAAGGDQDQRPPIVGVQQGGQQGFGAPAQAGHPDAAPPGPELVQEAGKRRRGLTLRNSCPIKPVFSKDFRRRCRECAK